MSQPPWKGWGKSLNVLLRSLQDVGERGPTVSLSAELVRAVNLKGVASDGCSAMFKSGVKIHWTEAFDDETFDVARARLTRGLKQAVSSLKEGDQVPAAVLRGIRADHETLSGLLDDRVRQVSPTQYIQGRRLLTELKTAIRGLSGPEATKQFTAARAARGETVAELVEHMSRGGLVFAAAAPGDEATYKALHLALRRYEERVLSTGKE